MKLRFIKTFFKILRMAWSCYICEQCFSLLSLSFDIQVRKRSTFLKVGQSVMSKKDLEVEKALKEKMIHSLMPPAVASEILKSRDERDKKDSAGEVEFKK